MSYLGAQVYDEAPAQVATHSGKRALAYRPDIDGLRALAIIPVILFHFDKTILPAGYLGVDVFFVISGFLITSLLVREWEANQAVSFIAFWRRRVLRILPALSVMVFVTFCLGQLVLYAPERYDLAVNSSAALLSFANFTHWLNYGSYWGAAADSSPLLHTWSLSVEEQFYVMYPLALFVVLKYARRWLIPIVAVGLVLSFCAYCWGVEAKPAATFYLLPTRAWELAAGAVSALLCSRRGTPALAKPAWAAAGMLLVAAGYFLIRTEGLSYFLWVPVLGTAMMLACNLGNGCFTTRALSLSPLVGIGKISYSLYLWHWPIFVFSDAIGERYSVTIGPVTVLAILVAVSFASYRFIERPARHAATLAPSLVVIVAVLAAMAFSLRNGNASESIERFSETRWEGQQYNVSPRPEWSASIERRMAGIQVADATHDVHAYSRGGIQHLYGSPTPEMVVLGDSHGLMWAPAIDAAARELKLSVAFFTADGTPAFFRIPLEPDPRGSEYFSDDQMRAFNKAKLAGLRSWRPKFVVIAARWSNYTAAEASSVLREAEVLGSRVILIGDPPLLDFGDRNAPQYIAYKGLQPGSGPLYMPIEMTGREEARIALTSILNSCRVCTSIPVNDVFLVGDKSLVARKNEVFYIDDDHVSTSGALLIRGKLIHALEQASEEAGK